MGLPLVHPQRPMLQSCACSVETQESPWLLCRRGFAKTLDEWIVKDSPQSERAAEAGFGELQYQDEGPVKGRRALYRNCAKKRGFFFESEQRSVWRRAALRK